MVELEKALIDNFGQGKLTNEDLTEILTYFQEEELGKNELFVKENEFCNRLSFQKSGTLRIYTLSEGKEITQWLSTSNYFITEISSFFFNKRSRWSIQALENVKLLTLSRENYNQICKDYPQWNDIEKNFIARCFATLENRVFTHLSMTSEERYDMFFENNRELFNQVPLQYIASLLGMSAETFSRIRKRKTKTS